MLDQFTAIVIAAQGGIPNVAPDVDGIPGADQLQEVLGWVLGGALILVAGAAVAGLAKWVLGKAAGAGGAMNTGRSNFGTALIAAAGIGATIFLVNFFFGFGRGIG